MHNINIGYALGGMLALVSLSAPASDTSLSFHGQTGLLTVPSGELLGAGQFNFQYNDHIDDFSNGSRRVDAANNYGFGVGITDWLELGGRLSAGWQDNTERDFIYNDLSASIKLKLYSNDWLAVAAGWQDFTGDAEIFRARYISGSVNYENLSVTAGYGIGPDRLDGAFAGVRYTAFNHVDLLADYDAENWHVGARLFHTFHNGMQIYGQGRLASGAQADDVSLAAGIALPLNGQKTVVPSYSANNVSKNVAGLYNSLVAAGLSRVRIGVITEGSLQLRFENRRYLRTYVDGWAVVRDIVQKHWPEQAAQLEIVEYRTGEPYLSQLVQRTIQKDDVHYHFQSTAWANKTAIKKWLAVQKNDRLAAELRLEPTFRHFIGTEVGVYDISLALQTILRLHLPAGLTVHGAYDTPVFQTTNFKDNNNYSGFRHKNTLSEGMLQLHYRPMNGLYGLASLGKQTYIRNDFYTFDNELAMHSASGAHQARLHTAVHTVKGVKADDVQALFSYRYWVFEHDTAVKLTVGRFLDKQNGAKLAVRRYFGNTYVELFWRGLSSTEQFAGMAMNIPFGPRTGMVPGKAYVTARAARVSAGTTVDGPDGRNILRPNFLVELSPEFNLENEYLDYDRVSPGYLNTH